MGKTLGQGSQVPKLLRLENRPTGPRELFRNSYICKKKPRKYVHNIKDKNYVAKKLLSGGDIVMQKQKNIIIIL